VTKKQKVDQMIKTPNQPIFSALKVKRTQQFIWRLLDSIRFRGLDRWINKSGATPNRSRTPAREPLFGPDVLSYVRSEKRNKSEKD
jgi:hypothetical protein